MSVDVREIAEQIHALDAEVADWPVAPPAVEVFRPPTALPDDLLGVSRCIGPTPFVLWDQLRLRRRVEELQRLLDANLLGLSVGLKACATADVLSQLARLGLGADAQSMGECALARRSGFQRVTATGPAFRSADMQELLSRGVLFDAQSPTQLGQLRAAGTTTPVGVRVRVALPDRLRHPATRTVSSRFGVPLDETGLTELTHGGVRVSRLRIHTGEALSADVAATLLYRIRLGLLLAEAVGSVVELNLGGGFLQLSRNIPALTTAFGRLGAVLRAGAPAAPQCWMEPGSALLLDDAYLVTEVLEVSLDRHAVTVDASPWNLAPWAFPSVHVLGREPWQFFGDVYGPALYENDRLRRTELHRPRGRVPAVGDRLIITSFGAYTLVHGRTFGQFPIPRQYVVDGTHVAEVR